MPAPQFKDLGKKAKDLFKKQYDFKHEIRVISKASGVKLESAGVHGKGGICGSTKANFKDEYFGDVEIEADSSGTARGQFKLGKVADGVDVTVAAAAAGCISGEATYKQDNVSALFKAAHNVNKGCTLMTAMATVGFEGVSVGGQVDIDANGAPKDYNVGAEYASKDLTAAIVTSNKGDDITVSFFQKLCGGTSLGASMLVQPESGNRVYTFGTDYALDKKTQVKAKANSQGTVGAVVTHILSDPSVKVAWSAEFNALSDDAFKAQKFGIGLTFGEF